VRRERRAMSDETREVESEKREMRICLEFRVQGY